MPTPEPEKRVKRPRLRLPFEKRKQDAGSWTYDHRIGLCVTLIAYLVLMIAFVSSKIVVGPLQFPGSAPERGGFPFSASKSLSVQIGRASCRERV